MLTHQWPRGFHRQLPADGGVPADLLPPGVDVAGVGSECAAEICAAVRPRYHFCAGEDASFARAPFRQPAAVPRGATIVTRMVGLAAISADKKKKWLHALSLILLCKFTNRVRLPTRRGRHEAFPTNAPHLAQGFRAVHFDCRRVGWKFWVVLALGQDLFVHCSVG